MHHNTKLKAATAGSGCLAAVMARFNAPNMLEIKPCPF